MVIAMKRKTHYRYSTGALPLIHMIAEKINLSGIIENYLSTHGNELIHPAQTIQLLAYNLCLGKTPLYKLEKWTQGIDFRCLGESNPAGAVFTDDRYGRALDKIYSSDRASLMTEIVLSSTKNFNLNLSRIHNDSTSIKTYGKLSGKTNTGVEIKRGHSKDHRPDLKQLVFSLSISADGGVPVHHKSYSGNRSDDTTHIETWNSLCRICASKDFLYVADSKLCTEKQLQYIVSNGGRAITIIPNTWSDVSDFKALLKTRTITKQEIWRRIKPGTTNEMEYFSVFSGHYLTKKGSYQIHWIFSSEKKKRDKDFRSSQIEKAVNELLDIKRKLNEYHLKSAGKINLAINNVFKKYKVESFISFEIGTTLQSETKQTSKGRPGSKTKFKIITTEIFTLQWSHNKKAIKEYEKADGIFPLLSTDHSLMPVDVLKAYKYQPKIEKRFTQFKSIHNAAPLLFKKVERVESNMFVFFIALMLQALIEREVQLRMRANGIQKIDVYPEQRCTEKPTANAIFELFESVSSYQIKVGEKVVEEYRDELDNTQIQILNLLQITPEQYWVGG